MTSPINIDPKDIQAYWAKYQDNKYVEGWASLWTKRADTIGGPLALDGHRRKALVPGCGRGVDVLLLASFGYDAYGLECSATAVDACKKEKENHSRYHVGDKKAWKGKVTFVQRDFFDNTWLKEIGVPRNGFDFFCALNPKLRPRWALRHTELLAPSPRGNLICLESPRHKNPLAPGPPFASPSEAYMEHLSRPGEKISYNDKGLVNADPLREPSKGGLERVAHWQPERTHTVGQGENGVIHDRVSIWRRRD
ncbi:S-adenosyl-L-methionine-dependent methyltransferase [Aspergillus pseudotamarii]|uniref:S-adenosyl-L-methionine-dependent methyltransferase n=1 Tax=Aspergillus pseudotamarii TaxID=132259 RepID=A0A5N6SFY1_ASPPS|nr:S-adenosyl-L-methionine-dependent methyltransferase [Aspergillus pseudotamarii]KAE8133582.1 S-adenosyl-L-methionine-dependent methyltransferase [Aspergillus pseudotamarii]